MINRLVNRFFECVCPLWANLSSIELFLIEQLVGYFVADGGGR